MRSLSVGAVLRASLGACVAQPYPPHLEQSAEDCTKERSEFAIWQCRQYYERESSANASTTNPVPYSAPAALVPPVVSSGTTEVSLVREGGTFKVPVLINDLIQLNFTVDSGASDVSIPADVVLVMMRTGTLMANDFMGSKSYVLADGHTVPSQTFRIRTLTVGGRVIRNVTAGMAGVTGSLLLGQSFLSHFHRWSINNSKQVIELE